MASQDAVVFLYRLFQIFHRMGEALHVCREQLQTLGQSFVPFRKAVQAFIGRHGYTLHLSILKIRCPTVRPKLLITLPDSLAVIVCKARGTRIFPTRHSIYLTSRLIRGKPVIQ
jgi:hypothetical protein